MYHDQLINNESFNNLNRTCISILYVFRMQISDMDYDLTSGFVFEFCGRGGGGGALWENAFSHQFPIRDYHQSKIVCFVKFNNVTLCSGDRNHPKTRLRAESTSVSCLKLYGAQYRLFVLFQRN